MPVPTSGFAVNFNKSRDYRLCMNCYVSTAGNTYGEAESTFEDEKSLGICHWTFVSWSFCPSAGGKPRGDVVSSTTR